jgi:hypothetical protein
MVEHEYTVLLERLGPRRGDRSAFFVLADTVATRSYSRRENGHGWLGIRFQTQAGGGPSDVLIHVYLFDRDPVREQEALGIVGVNLAAGAFYHHAEPARLVESLMDGVEERVEIDMVKLSGPAFGGFDNRLASLQLVELGFTDAVMLASDGEVVQPSEVLYKRPLLVGIDARGSEPAADHGALPGRWTGSAGPRSDPAIAVPPALSRSTGRAAIPSALLRVTTAAMSRATAQASRAGHHPIVAPFAP